MFENAKWITAPISDADDASFLFAKEFSFGKKVKKAVLNISMLGYGEVTINGEKITDEVLSTPFTAFDKTVLYNTYDVTKFAENDFSLGVFLGNGQYNDVAVTWNFEKAPWRHHKKLIAELDITFCTGEVTSFVSDKTWKTALGPCTYNHSREGEIYDARLEIKGWDSIGFDRSSWENAVITKAPGGVLKPVTMPPVKVIRTIKPIAKIGDVYDFGEGISGWVRITVEGKRGEAVKCEYSERLHDDGSINAHSTNCFLERTGSKHINYDEYILKGEGVETYAPKFCYHGFRYVKVSGAPEKFNIVAEVVHTDLETVGSFCCSDDMLNKIHEASVRSTLTNYLSVPTDCPHREQNGWTGDAFISCQQALMNFDMKASYEKWMDDFKDAQRPSGQLPGIIPTGSWGFNWGSGPAWDGAMFGIPWYVYQNTGDKSLLIKMWDNMKKYMGFIRSMADDYIVDFGLGDWCPPKDSNPPKNVVTDTSYYYFFANLMAKVATLLGEDGNEYEVLADNIKRAFRGEFFEDKELLKNQTFLSCVIFQGLCNSDEVPNFAKMLNDAVIEKDYHIDCGILGAKYIFSALSENGYAETVYKMVTNPTCPSYAYWINSGFNNLCESWEIVNSCNHHMYSEVDHWFYRHIAGIHLDENGLLIKPCFVVDWAKATHKNIKVEWDKNEIRIFAPIASKLEMGGKVFDLKIGENTIKR